jgi:hypothetical protein
LCDNGYVAAAVAGPAHNLSDFPAARLAEYWVTVTEPVTYLCGLFGEVSGEVTSSVARSSGRNVTADEYGDLLGRLERAGVMCFAGLVRRPV